MSSDVTDLFAIVHNGLTVESPEYPLQEAGLRALRSLEEQKETLTERNQFLSTEIVRLEIVIRAAIEMGLDHPDALETLHAALRPSNPASEPQP